MGTGVIRPHGLSTNNCLFMTPYLVRASCALFGFALLASLVPLPAEAQSRSGNWFRNSREGTIREEERGGVLERRGISSSIRRKIDKLDDDPVDEMPIPILAGFSVANLSRNFGDPRDGGARSHEGLDLMAPEGAYLVSPTEAVVIRVGTGSSAGKYVYTANPGDETFAYMHLDDFADGLRAGDELEPGDLIGYVGNTGNASGGATHLHFEIRDGREATDPYPRLTEEFTAKERIAAFERILEDADSDDRDEVAEDIVSRYRAVLIAARASGIELPDELAEELGTTVSGGITLAGGQPLFMRDLTLGFRGDDVIALQSFLITQDAGPSAKALAVAGATGYFGPATQAALAEFQAKEKIAPAAGYFGAFTRARILSSL